MVGVKWHFSNCGQGLPRWECVSKNLFIQDAAIIEDSNRHFREKVGPVLRVAMAVLHVHLGLHARTQKHLPFDPV
jgi:hypothetical protein